MNFLMHSLNTMQTVMMTATLSVHFMTYIKLSHGLVACIVVELQRVHDSESDFIT